MRSTVATEVAQKHCAPGQMASVAVVRGTEPEGRGIDRHCCVLLLLLADRSEEHAADLDRSGQLLSCKEGARSHAWSRGQLQMAAMRPAPLLLGLCGPAAQNSRVRMSHFLADWAQFDVADITLRVLGGSPGNFE